MHCMHHAQIASCPCLIAGDSRHGLYNGGGVSGKREMYEGRHLAQCTRGQAIGITVFVVTAIFLTSLAIAFVRPFNGKGKEASLALFVPNDIIEKLI